MHIKYIKRIVSFCLTLFYLFSVMNINVSANENIASEVFSTTDAIMENSIIMFDGSGVYYAYGEKKTITVNGGMSRFTNNGAPALSALAYSDVFGIAVSWDKSTETVTLKKDGTTVTSRIGEDAVVVNGVQKYNTILSEYSGDAVMLPLVPILTPFGYTVHENDRIIIITKNNVEIETDIKVLNDIKNLFETYIFYDDFEETPQMIFRNDWGGSNRGNGTEIMDDGNTVAYMETTTTGWEGFVTPLIYRGDHWDIRDASYEISFSLKVSEDFKSNKISLAAFKNEGETFQRMVSIATITPPTPGEWANYSFCMITPSFSKIERVYNADSFQVILRVSGSDPEATGTVYFDDFSIKSYYPKSQYIEASMKADSFAAWYVLGETVTYNPQFPERLEGTKSILATVYDSVGNVFYESETPTSEVVKNGWKWTPEENGWYEVEFKALYHDGTTATLCNTRTTAATGNGSYGDYNHTKPAFFVAPTKTKPLEERNETLYYSSSVTNLDVRYHQDFHKLADMMGMYGLRKIAVSWGERPDAPVGTEISKGVYDWTQMENTLEVVDKYGFDLVVCIMSTPYWAAIPDNEMKDTSGKLRNPYDFNSMGNYTFNCYAPENIEDWEDFIRNVAERYKGKIPIYEIWNEPMLGQTAFWYDTPEAYAELLTSAAKVIKEVDPDAKVSTAGMGNNETYQNFMRELLKADPDLLSKIDYWAVHGRYDTISQIKEIMKEHNDGKTLPWINTEAYPHNAGLRDGGTNDRSATILFILNYLMHYKQGGGIYAFYDFIDTNREQETAAAQNLNDWSPFRNLPQLEPEITAAGFYTFTDLMQKEFSYNSEYETESGQKMVVCNNGDGNFAVLWNPVAKDSIIPKSVLDAMTDTSKVITMDGRIRDKSYTIPAHHLIYVTDLDVDKLAIIKGDPNTALNTEYQTPWWNCLDPSGAEKAILSNLISMDNAKEKPFDEKTMVVSNNVQWVEDGYEWNAYKEQLPTGYSAKHTVYVDTTGLYLMVDVTDNNIVTPKSNNQIWNADGIQFAFKATNDGNNETQMNEFSVGLVEGKPVVYKEIEAKVTSDQPPIGYNSAGTVVEDAKVSIENTGRGLLYKVYLPAEQMWPYIHSDYSEYLRFSICINNDDGTGRNGWLQWSKGIASGGKDVSKYGKIDFKKENP